MCLHSGCSSVLDRCSRQGAVIDAVTAAGEGAVSAAAVTVGKVETWRQRRKKARGITGLEFPGESQQSWINNACEALGRQAGSLGCRSAYDCSLLSVALLQLSSQ